MDQRENSSLCLLVTTPLGLLSSRGAGTGAAQCPSGGADRESYQPPSLGPQS